MAIIQHVQPDRGEALDRFTVTLSGDTMTGVTGASFGVGVTVLRVQVFTDGDVRVKIEIDETAKPGLRDVAVTGPAASDQYVLRDGFTVL